MKVDFKYSIYNEISEYITMITHPKDYSFLRSVVWNPLFILKGCINQKRDITKAEKFWKPIESDVGKAFKDLNLKLKKEAITCYIHNTGCEGWFDVDNNRIHVRISRVNEGEILGAVIHELVHLATCKKGQDYNKGEEITDSYLAKKPLSDILKRVGDKPQSPIYIIHNSTVHHQFLVFFSFPLFQLCRVQSCARYNIK